VSGYCVDGVCCDAACDNACQRCDGIGSTGTCRAYQPGSNTGDECGAQGVCDGGDWCVGGAVRRGIGFGDGQTQEALAVASNGTAIAITGQFDGTIEQLGGTLVAAKSVDKTLDVFVAKLDSDGSPQWSRSFGSVDVDRGNGVALTDSGDVALVGWYKGSLTLEKNAPLPKDSVAYNGFVTLLGEGGEPKWSRAIGTEGKNQQVFAVATHPDCGIVFAGSFVDTIDLGGKKLGPGDGSFLACFDLTGKHVWTTSISSGGIVEPAALAVRSDGSIVVVGLASGNATFGSTLLKGYGGRDVFVVSVDAKGEMAWAHRFGGVADDAASGVAVDSRDTAYVTGYFAADSQFGSLKLTNAGMTDAFLVTIDAKGNPASAIAFGDAAAQEGRAIAVDAHDNVVLAGVFAGNMRFGNAILSSAGWTDIFLARMTSTGVSLWSRGFGDKGRQHLAAIALGAQGAINAVGSFDGGFDLGGKLVTNNGGWDGVIAIFDR
jgi:hypothetical protein